MSAKWLASLVRARQVQEDHAKQQLASAERLARSAHARVRYDADRLDSLCAAGAQDAAPAFVAAAVALQAAAATHAAAIDTARLATDTAEQKRGTVSEAARSRRTAEELQDRQVQAEKLRTAAAAQRELDETAARIHRDATAATSAKGAAT